MADARTIEFLELIDEPAVDQVQGLFRVHLVGTLEITEGHQGLVFQQPQNSHLAHDGGVELGLLLGGFGIAGLFGLGSDSYSFDGVVHDLAVFLLVDPLGPGYGQNAAAVFVEEPALVTEVKAVYRMGKGELLGVAVSNLDPPAF